MTVTVDPPIGLIEQGEWLVDHRWEIDRGEAAWLVALATFDRDQGWLLDDQLSCVDWLACRAKMARATAYEKLQVAHELVRRPLLSEAFTSGRISYSAVRACCRIHSPGPEVDHALITLAEAGSVADVERAVRHYRLLAEQEQPPADPTEKRGLRIRRGHQGYATIEILLTDVEAEELAAALMQSSPTKMGRAPLWTSLHVQKNPVSLWTILHVQNCLPITGWGSRHSTSPPGPPAETTPTAWRSRRRSARGIAGPGGWSTIPVSGRR